jgi:hypothetical protein
MHKVELSKKGEIQSTLDALWISVKVSGNGTTLFTREQLYLSSTTPIVDAELSCPFVWN